MNINFLSDRTIRIAVLTLIFGAFVLAIIDPNVRPLFIEAAKACLTLYIGRSLPEIKA